VRHSAPFPGWTHPKPGIGSTGSPHDTIPLQVLEIARCSTVKRGRCQSPPAAGLQKRKPLISQGLRLAGGARGIRTLGREMTLRLISSQVHSTTLPSLQLMCQSILSGAAQLISPKDIKHATQSSRLSTDATPLAPECCHLLVDNFQAPPPKYGPRPSLSRSRCVPIHFYLAHF
jgi:hypothetical protein